MDKTHPSQNFATSPFPAGKDAFGNELKVGDIVVACHNSSRPFVKGKIIKLSKCQATYVVEGFGDYKFHTDYAHIAKI